MSKCTGESITHLLLLLWSPSEKFDPKWVTDGLFLFEGTPVAPSIRVLVWCDPHPNPNPHPNPEPNPNPNPNPNKVRVGARSCPALGLGLG